MLHQTRKATLDGATYIYDEAGNRLSRQDNRTGVTTTYAYDAIYELTQVTEGGTTKESYSYDPVGNRLSSLGVSPYSYNSPNELLSEPGVGFTYDYNGNTLTKVVGSNTTTYAWDYENRLTSVTLPGSGGTVTFKYDPFGRRIYKSSSSGTSIYAYDGLNLVEETNSGGGVVARYTEPSDVDQPLAMLRSGTTSYYEQDGLGSVTSLTNTAGALAQTYTYDSFGNTTNSSGSLTNFFRYTAREFDTETNLYFLRARYLDPSTGRFLSEDPLTFLGGHNFYDYVGNEPTSFIDPTGLAKICNLPPVGPHSKLPTPINKCASEPLINCIIQTESSGNPNAVSPKGATGLMQLTPPAINELGQRGLLQPGMSNQQMGTAYINLLLSYCSNVTTSLAAYNAGPFAVNKAGGIPANNETQNYVKKINNCLEKSGLPGGVNDPGATCGCK